MASPPRSKAGFLCVLLLLVLIPALPSPTTAQADQFPIALWDAMGRVVTIPHRPQRIISLAPSVTEVLFALGLDREVVGISSADDYPPEKVAARQRIGGVQLNFEVIVALRPDLIIGLPSLQRPNLERLIHLGLPVLAVDANDLDETFEKILLIGRATGQRRQATLLVAQMRFRSSAIARQVAQVGTTPKVYVEIWNEPLITVAAGTFLHDLLVRAGASNIFADLRGWPQVSAEAVIARNPDVIILTYPNKGELMRRPGWGRVSALRARRVYEVETTLVARPGPRIVDGLEMLAKLLHPGRFGGNRGTRSDVGATGDQDGSPPEPASRSAGVRAEPYDPRLRWIVHVNPSHRTQSPTSTWLQNAAGTR